MGECLNEIFIIAAAAIGLFALLMEWAYILEAKRGIYIVDFKEYHHYINVMFSMSLIAFIVLWFTVREIEQLLIWVFLGAAAGWFLTALVGLFLSIFSRSAGRDNRAVIRRVLLPCVIKTMIFTTCLWLIY